MQWMQAWLFCGLNIDRDESIRRLLEKRRLLIDVFKQHTYGYSMPNAQLLKLA